MSLLLLGIPIGVVLLYLGAEWTVSGAKDLALRLGVTPFVVGLTVVAFGSSSPETVTALVSGDNPEIIIGNIVGSNILNIGLAVGLMAVLAPIACVYKMVRFEIVAMLVAVTAISVLSLNGSLGTLQGAILIVTFSMFLALVYLLKKDSGESTAPGEAPALGMSTAKCVVFVAIGICVLYIGARGFVGGAVELAGMLGVSDLLIGLVIVAVGTGLPELCISLVATRRHENELVVSNVVGSIVFNSLFALGIGTVFFTVPINHYMLVFHMPVMILMAIALAAMIRLGNRVGRVGGAALAAAYITYVCLTVTFPELTWGAS
ncbi:MAG: calcium/sodium antiporter [Candidatus Methanoplasma sp.]|jgi:cation:H+ antiporter|nr:calcium/sodium antiporter [Candidatus Methanoplasma sp.]